MVPSLQEISGLVTLANGLISKQNPLGEIESTKI